MNTNNLKQAISIMCLLFFGLIPQFCNATQASTTSTVADQQSESLSEEDLAQFASWIAGSWDNVKQVQSEIQKGLPEEDRHHRYAMRYTEIETPAVRGRTFAIENYEEGDGLAGAIARVSLHRFMLSDARDNIIHEFLFLKDQTFRDKLIGNLDSLEDITEDDFRVRKGCRLYWRWTGNSFEGQTKTGACITSSYTDREITVEGSGILEFNRLRRHDRNFELSGEEISRPGHKTKEVFDRISEPNK